MNKSKRKGTDAETAVVRFLVEEGFLRAERRALQGNEDRGDIAGIDGVIIEVKAEAKPSFAVYQREALREAANDGGSLPIVVWKRPHKNIRQWVAQIPVKCLMGEAPEFGDFEHVRWASMDLQDMTWYLRELDYGY